MCTLHDFHSSLKLDLFIRALAATKSHYCLKKTMRTPLVHLVNTYYQYTKPCSNSNTLIY